MKTATKTLTHYIGMNGSHGCMPDNCFAVETAESAIESLSDLLELTDEQKDELSSNGIVECTHEQGAEYAEVSACTCSTPWEHNGERNQEDEWPEYVRAAVIEFLDTLETHKYQEQKVSDHSELCQCFNDSVTKPDTYYCRSWHTMTFYILPHASFGDYDGSTDLERANAREFREMFDFVSSHIVVYGEYTGIDETDVEHINWEQLEHLKETCNSLDDYPVINEETMGIVAEELHNEAWDNWLCSDFRKEVINHFCVFDTEEENEALEAKIDELSSDTLREMLESAAQVANEYWEIESGGNAYIRLERLIPHVVLPTEDETN